MKFRIMTCFGVRSDAFEKGHSSAYLKRARKVRTQKTCPNHYFPFFSFNLQRSASAFSKKRYPCEYVTKEDEGKLEWELPLACCEKFVSYCTKREIEARKNQRTLKSVGSRNETAAYSAKRYMCEYETKENQRSTFERDSGQTDKYLSRTLACTVKSKPGEYEWKNDRLPWERRAPCILKQSTSAFSKNCCPCDYVTKDDEATLEWKLPSACSENSIIHSTKIEFEAKKNQRKLESDRLRADNKKTCPYVTYAYGEDKDQRALERDIPQADDE
ncbi:uncharacterized protein ACN427_008744 [Glossina fuscipes fuscipes]